MEKETEEKFVALEMKLTYLEDFVEKLQQVSLEQSDALEKLAAENKILSAKIDSILHDENG
jgi:SlyX protein